MLRPLGPKPRSPGFAVFVDKCGGGRAHWQTRAASPVRVPALKGLDVPWPKPSASLRLVYPSTSAHRMATSLRSTPSPVTVASPSRPRASGMVRSSDVSIRMKLKAIVSRPCCRSYLLVWNGRRVSPSADVVGDRQMRSADARVNQRLKVPVRAAWPVTRPVALRRSSAAFGCGGWGRCGAIFGAAVRLEDEEINREHDYRGDGDYDVPVVHRISPHSSPGELQRTPTASDAIQMCGRMWMRSRRGKMGPVYSIRSGRDDPRGCYAGSGESLAAWAGGIYRSCAGAECRLLAQSRRSAATGFRSAYRRLTDLRG